MIAIGEMQRDALTETFNIGVGRAASGLSMIVSEPVELTVPSLVFMDSVDLNATLIDGPPRRISKVIQDYHGPFDARAMLIFKEENALLIVAQMIGDQVGSDELAEMAQEALCEIGNIILNACMSALADTFEIQLEGGLPVHEIGQSDRVYHTLQDQNKHAVVLVLHATMSIRQNQIDGDLLFLLSVSSLNELMRHVDLYLARTSLMR